MGARDIKYVGTKREVIKKCKQFAKQYWGLEFNLEIKLDGRLSKKLGKYYYKKDYDFTNDGIEEKIKGNYIKFARFLVESGDYYERTVDSVIKHELAHWAFSIMGKPFDDHHPIFEEELKRIGASSTNTVGAAGELHLAVCSECDKIIKKQYHKGRLNGLIKEDSRYVSNCCKANIIYGGTRYFEDDYVKKENNNNEYKINDLIQPNEYGRVTNGEMIPVLKDIIDNNNDKTIIDKIKIIKDNYHETYISSLKYIGKKRNNKLSNLGLK
jgi:predicted SprT family Zn-dependent metalloprotease